jgi:hypothetical protein
MDPAAWLDTNIATSLLLRIQCNAHWISGVADAAATRIGMGLYPVASSFNHSCMPNCVRPFSFFLSVWCMHVCFCPCHLFFIVCVLWYSPCDPFARTQVKSYDKMGIMEFRVLRDIHVGEEMSYSYIDLYTPRDTRLSSLQRAYFFECKCGTFQSYSSWYINHSAWCTWAHVAVRCFFLFCVLPETVRCVEPLHTSFDRFIGGFRCVAVVPSTGSSSSAPASAQASASFITPAPVSAVEVAVDAPAAAASAAPADESDAAALLSRTMNSLIQPVMEPADICGGLLNTWAGASAQVVCTKCGQVLPWFPFHSQSPRSLFVHACSSLCMHTRVNAHHEQAESTTSLQIAETTGATILNGGIFLL